MKNVSAYFNHIQYGDETSPTLDVLYNLHRLHARTIPFENLSSFTGAEVRIDIASILEKFTVQKRGGYCFEHNTLLQYVLEKIGFKTTGLAARVRLNVADDVVTPRSHMFLLVEADGEQWIADAGFGGMSLTVPIRFVVDEIQTTPHGQYCLTRNGDFYCLEANVQNEWKMLYVFDLTAHHHIDYEVYNWYVSRHRDSHFVSSLVAARADKDGRHTLRNTQYSFYALNGETQKIQLQSVADIKSVLGNTFYICTDGVKGLDERLNDL